MPGGKYKNQNWINDLDDEVTADCFLQTNPQGRGPLSEERQHPDQGRRESGRRREDGRRQVLRGDDALPDGGEGRGQHRHRRQRHRADGPGQAQGQAHHHSTGVRHIPGHPPLQPGPRGKVLGHPRARRLSPVGHHGLFAAGSKIDDVFATKQYWGQEGKRAFRRRNPKLKTL